MIDDVDMSQFLKEKKLLLVCALIFALVFLRDCAGLEVNKFVFVAIYVCSFAALCSQDIVKLVVFSIPLSYGLPNNYIFLASAVFLLIKARDTFDHKALAIPMLLFSQELFSCLGYTSFSLVDEVAYLCVLLLFAILLHSKSEDTEGVVVSYIVGVSAAFVVLIVSTSNSVGLENLLSGSVRLGYDSTSTTGAVAVEYMHVRFNPNETAYYSISALSCAFALMTITGNRRPLIIGCIAICLVAGMLSFSRTWVLSFALMILLFAIAGLRGFKHFVKMLLILTVAGGLIAVFLSVNPEIMDRIVARFMNADLATAGGRTALFDAYNEFFFGDIRHFLLGSGVVEYRAVTGVWNSLHSGFQQIYVCLGVVGGILYVGMIVNAIVKAARENIVTLANFIPLICVVLFGQSVQLLNPSALMLPLACCVFVIKLKSGGKKSTVAKRGGGSRAVFVD